MVALFLLFKTVKLENKEKAGDVSNKDTIPTSFICANEIKWVQALLGAANFQLQ